MFHKLGSIFRIEFTVLDSEEQRVEGASPLCRIINDVDKKYWTGSFWQAESVSLPMAEVGDGVYEYAMNFTSPGNYTVHCDDDKHGVHNTFTVRAYNSSERTVYTAAGNSYTAKFLARDGEGNCVDDASLRMTIRSDATGEYLAAAGRTEDYAEVPMSLFGEGVYIYIFTPDVAEEYTITCFDETYNLSCAYALKAIDLTATSGENSLISVNSSGLNSTDGTNSTIKDADGNPMSEAIISAYDSENSLVARCMSIYDGTWQMYLRAGQYRFEFKKDGYLPVSFGRTVE